MAVPQEIVEGMREGIVSKKPSLEAEASVGIVDPSWCVMSTD